jgi:hypothetical protein
MFHADLCRHLGISLEDGIKADLGGVVGGAKADLYFHKIKILVGGYQVTTMAGFSKNITVAGLLGPEDSSKNSSSKSIPQLTRHISISTKSTVPRMFAHPDPAVLLSFLLIRFEIRER